MDLIATIPELERLAGRLRGEPLIAADTEAAGFHRYMDRLCLLQLSVRDRTWLVDTLAVGSLNPLADLFEDPEVEIVFHDADYDLRLLDRDFGLHVRGLFDTQIAARFLGERSFGLAALLEQHLGIELEKKFQRADWAKRPLSAEMLEYAAMDTRHLPELRDRLRRALDESGRLGWAEEEFRHSEHTSWEPPADEDLAYLRVKGTRDMDGRALAAMRELYAWREAVARDRDVAPFRVLSNEGLVGLAMERPGSERGLESVRGVSSSHVRRYGAELMAALRRAAAVPDSELPERPRSPRRERRDPELEDRIDRLKAVRDREAERLELERGFLMPRSQLEELARARPRDAGGLESLESVRRWQVEALGEALLEALDRNGTTRP